MKKGMKRIFIKVLFSIFVINVLVLPGVNTEGNTKVKFNKLQPQEFQLKVNDGQIILMADLDNKYREYRNFRLKIGQKMKPLIPNAS
jgi:phage anti-repressor protein